MLSDKQTAKIGEQGEQIEDHLKWQQAGHGLLTLTGVYNVLEKLRAGDELTAKNKTIHA